MNVPHSFLMIVVVVAVAALFPLTATAQPPTTVLLAVNDVQVFAGADSPCPFDVTFTGPERSSSQPTTTTAARRSVRPSTAHSPTPSSAPGARWCQTDRRRCTSTSAPGRWSTPARSLPFTSRVMRSSSANPADSHSRPTEASSPSPDIPFLKPARYAPRCPRERADEHVGNDLGRIVP